MGKENVNYARVELQRMKDWLKKVEDRLSTVEEEVENEGDFKWVAKASIYRFYLEETISKFNRFISIK